MPINNMFAHTNDPKWIRLRQIEWEEHIERHLKVDGYTKSQIQAIKDFSFSGDIAKLLDKLKRNKSPLLMSEVLFHAPFNKRTEFDFVVKYYCENYLDDKVNAGLINLESCRKVFTSYLISLIYRLDYPFIGRLFCEETIEILFGSTFSAQSTEYPLEFPVIGKPEIRINPDVLINSLLPVFTDYLFNKDRHEAYSVYKPMVDYCLSLFPHLDTYPFTLKKLENRYYGDEYDYEPKLNQSVFRMFFSNVYGYMHEFNEIDEFGFFDPTLQAYMKCKIEDMKLGAEYDALIDMIHRHEGKVLLISE